MARPIGYYVHHQGAGHLHRARLIAGALERPCTLIGSNVDADDATMLLLPDDRMDVGFDAVDGTSSRPTSMHYAPVNHAGVRARMVALAAWVAAHDPVLMIVDVSVEIALFVRLLSVPLVLVRLAGRRDDAPHLEAFRAAERLIAPFPAGFESASTPTWVKDKTIYAGFLSAPTIARQVRSGGHEIAVVLGRGAAPIALERLAKAASATPDWTWRVYGDMANGSCPPNLHLYGWVDTIDTALDRAEIIIGGAGDGLLSAVVARGSRFICVPEPRAFGEQIEKANVLADGNFAVVLAGWPEAEAWPAILLRAMALDPEGLHRFHDRDAVVNIASGIEAICEGSRRPCSEGPSPP